MADSQNSPGVYIRVANAKDLNELAAMIQRAFISSPPQTFFSGATTRLTTDSTDAKRRAHQTKFLNFFIRRSWSMGARITVAILPNKENNPDKIVGITIWRPPGDAKPPSLVNALRLGLFSVVVIWGLGVMTVNYLFNSLRFFEHVLGEGYAKRKLAGTPEDAWYLQLAGVDPEFQGKGYMSMLLREGFKYTPRAVFTLEATTPRSRDVYKHFGFEVVKEVMVGKGKVDASGVIASGNAATGFPIYPMIRASPSQPL
ncbi:hypothetical protein DFH06DRAFT_1329612 [Mycena polygramma]|nr:hypothetical protein DFH06DRAFT_1329612 [Mycena polygramma]